MIIAVTYSISIANAKLATHADGHSAPLRPALPHHGACISSLQCRLFHRILSLHRQILPSLLRRARRLHHAKARRSSHSRAQSAILRSPRASYVYHQPRPPAQPRDVCLPRTRLPGALAPAVDDGFPILSNHPPASHTAPPSAAPRSIAPASPAENRQTTPSLLFPPASSASRPASPP
jgi:hypothetical protein